MFPLNDAYITLHNAQVLRKGADPNHSVAALTGVTSQIHLALVTFALLALPPELSNCAAASAEVMLFLLPGLGLLLIVLMALHAWLSRAAAS